MMGTNINVLFVVCILIVTVIDSHVGRPVIGMIVLLFAFGMVLAAFIRWKRHLVKTRSTYLMITVLEILLVYSIIITNRQVNQERCNEAIHAVEKYRLEKHELPKRLEDLVPEYLVEVPTMRIGLWEQGEVRYGVSSQDGTEHFFIGFGFLLERSVFSSIDRRWYTSD